MASDRPNPRSRRSHTNLSNLRLAPLPPDFTPDAAPVFGTSDLDYQAHHSSYIQGKSAPSTPGILGRSSSRRQLGGGLSRKLSIYDINAPSYAAVEVNHDGAPMHGLHPDATPGTMPKAKSEAALAYQRRALTRVHTQLSQHSGGSTRNHRRSQTGGRSHGANQDDWLTRTGLATTSLLRESKGQSWLVSRDSSTSLAAADLSDDEVDSIARLSVTSHQRLHFADDELSPETPRYTSRWGSRFGSRAASARNSRRGSMDLARPASIHIAQDGYFDDYQSPQHDEAVKPDFVDVDEDSDSEDAEEEIARLARERSFGFGGLVDRLVGWSLFNVDEDREGTDVEDEDKDRPKRAENVSTPKGSTATATSPARAQTPTETQPEAQEEGGWQDAAWLLSLASKVIL